MGGNGFDVRRRRGIGKDEAQRLDGLNSRTEDRNSRGEKGRASSKWKDLGNDEVRRDRLDVPKWNGRSSRDSESGASQAGEPGRRISRWRVYSVSTCHVSTPSLDAQCTPEVPPLFKTADYHRLRPTAPCHPLSLTCPSIRVLQILPRTLSLFPRVQRTLLLPRALSLSLSLPFRFSLAFIRISTYVSNRRHPREEKSTQAGRQAGRPVSRDRSLRERNRDGISRVPVGPLGGLTYNRKAECESNYRFLWRRGRATALAGCACSRAASAPRDRRSPSKVSGARICRRSVEADRAAAIESEPKRFRAARQLSFSNV